MIFWYFPFWLPPVWEEVSVQDVGQVTEHLLSAKLQIRWHTNLLIFEYILFPWKTHETEYYKYLLHLDQNEDKTKSFSSHC